MKILKGKLLITIVIIAFVILFANCSSNNVLKNNIDKNLKYFFISNNIFISKIDFNSDNKIEEIINDIYLGKYKVGLEKIEELVNSNTNLYNNCDIKNLIGICYVGLAKHEKSIKIFNNCINSTNLNEIQKMLIYNNLANNNLILSNLKLANEYYNKIESLDSNSLFNICVEYNKALYYGQEERYEAKKQQLLQIQKILKFKYPQDKVINKFIEIAYLISDNNKYPNSDVISKIQKIISELQNYLGAEHPEIATLYNIIGNIYCIDYDYINAINFFNISLEIQNKNLPKKHFDLTNNYNNLNACYSNINKFDLARKYAYLSFEILFEHPDNYINFAINLNNTGMIYYQNNNYKTAIDYFIKAYYISSLNNFTCNLFQISLDNIRNCYIELNYDISKFEVWMEEQTRDMTKDKVYAEIEEILNGSDWN